ncbi:unnamed protein product [Arabis nemorensis]|uniref:Uncharacterized protein n=1 Tax=Arabis nemorensis TaxID=586526 RepID=A0A565BCL6_9BRAS|nr:unnamed protein product [Arabis nemorensis]
MISLLQTSISVEGLSVNKYACGCGQHIDLRDEKKAETSKVRKKKRIEPAREDDMENPSILS